jgi:hypothetical protein
MEKLLKGEEFVHNFCNVEKNGAKDRIERRTRNAPLARGIVPFIESQVRLKFYSVFFLVVSDKRVFFQYI